MAAKITKVRLTNGIYELETSIGHAERMLGFHDSVWALVSDCGWEYVGGKLQRVSSGRKEGK